MALPRPACRRPAARTRITSWSSSRTRTTSSPERSSNSSSRSPMKIRLVVHALIATAACAAFAIADHHAVLQAQDCARRYVASGDHYPAGHDIEEAERFPDHLLEDLLKK